MTLQDKQNMSVLECEDEEIDEMSQNECKSIITNLLRYTEEQIHQIIIYKKCGRKILPRDCNIEEILNIKN